MANFVYWSFVLASIPFAPDLLIRAAIGVGNWVAFHHRDVPAAASSTCIDLRWNGQSYCRTPRQSRR